MSVLRLCLGSVGASRSSPAPPSTPFGEGSEYAGEFMDVPSRSLGGNAQKRCVCVLGGSGGQAFWSHCCQQGKEGVWPNTGRGEAERPQDSPMVLAPGGAAAKRMPPQALKEMSYLERTLG